MDVRHRQYDNIYLSEFHLHILESFQAEIGKCILGISKYHLHVSILVWPSIKASILIWKLIFLAKLLERDGVLRIQMMHAQ